MLNVSRKQAKIKIKEKNKNKNKKKEKRGRQIHNIYIPYYITKDVSRIHPTTFSCLCALASICCTPILVCIHVYYPLRPWEHHHL